LTGWAQRFLRYTLLYIVFFAFSIILSSPRHAGELKRFGFLPVFISVDY